MRVCARARACACVFSSWLLEKKNSTRVCFDCSDVPVSLAGSGQVRTERSSLFTWILLSCLHQSQTFFSEIHIWVCKGERCLRFLIFVHLKLFIRCGYHSCLIAGRLPVSAVFLQWFLPVDGCNAGWGWDSLQHPL